MPQIPRLGDFTLPGPGVIVDRETKKISYVTKYFDARTYVLYLILLYLVHSE